MVSFLIDQINLYSIAQHFKNSERSNSLFGHLLSTKPVSQLSYFADNGGTLVEVWFILHFSAQIWVIHRSFIGVLCPLAIFLIAFHLPEFLLLLMLGFV